MALLSSLASGFAGYHQQIRGGAIGFGAPTSGFNPTQMATTTAAVGIISSPIELNLNPETQVTRASVMRLPYDEIVYAVMPQLTFEMDQFSIWNIALGMSLEDDAVSSSSRLQLDFAYLRQEGNMTGNTGQAITNAGFYACEVLTTAPPASEAAASGTSSWQFWKTKVFSSGAIPLQGDDLTRIPVRVQIFGNDSDQAGEIANSVAHTKVAYDGA